MNYAGVFFLTGIVSSVHCIGMCGTLTASLAAGSSSPVRFQILISAGRSLSYVLLGAFAGSAGTLLFYQNGAARLLLAIFSVSAGLYGVLLLRGKEPFSLYPRLKGLFRWLIPVKTPSRALAIGFINPLLPCPLLHAALALAVFYGGAVNGAICLFFFSAGTSLPLFITSVFLESIVRRSGAFHMRSAGGIMLLASLFSLARVWRG